MRHTMIWVLCLVTGVSISNAQPGCMSKSQGLKQKFDTKAWHYVACNCDCAKNDPQGLYAQKRTICIECRHRHEPRPLIIMSQTTPIRETTSLEFPPSARAAVQMAINRYRRLK